MRKKPEALLIKRMYDRIWHQIPLSSCYIKSEEIISMKISGMNTPTKGHAYKLFVFISN